MLFLKRSGFLIGYCWAALGCGLLLTGLAVDLAQHASEHIHDDQVFDFSNPGHVIAIAGIYNLAAGLILSGFSRWALNHLSVRKSLGALVIVLAAGTAFSLLIVRLDGRETAGDGISEVSASHSPTNLPAHHAQTSPSPLEESTFHDAVNNAPVTPENLTFAQDFLSKAREATAKYQDVNVAEQDGFVRITQYLPFIGAHFLNPNGSRRLDPAHPQILLYQAGSNGSWILAGVAYVMPKRPGVEAPPRTPLGSLAQWHYHTDLCFDLQALAVSSAESAAECRGTFAAETPWLLHAWIWIDSPEGVFNHANSLLQ